MDSESTKFCSTHGILLEDGRKCTKCDGIRFDFAKELKEKNKTNYFDRFFLRDYGQSIREVQYYVCDGCKYFM